MKKNGFTLIEVMIVIALIMIVLPSTFLLGEKVYNYSGTVRVHNEMSVAANKIFVEIRKDVKLSSGYSIDPDNHGITIETKDGGEIHYRFDSGEFTRASGDRTARLSPQDITDASFIDDNGRLIFMVEINYTNVNTRKPAREKFFYGMW